MPGGVEKLPWEGPPSALIPGSRRRPKDPKYGGDAADRLDKRSISSKVTQAAAAVPPPPRFCCTRRFSKVFMKIHAGYGHHGSPGGGTTAETVTARAAALAGCCRFGCRCCTDWRARPLRTSSTAFWPSGRNRLGEPLPRRTHLDSPRHASEAGAGLLLKGPWAQCVPCCAGRELYLRENPPGPPQLQPPPPTPVPIATEHGSVLVLPSQLVALGAAAAVEDTVGGAWALAPAVGMGRAAADLLERGGPRLYGGDMKRYSKVYERALRATDRKTIRHSGALAAQRSAMFRGGGYFESRNKVVEATESLAGASRPCRADWDENDAALAQAAAPKAWNPGQPALQDGGGQCRWALVRSACCPLLALLCPLPHPHPLLPRAASCRPPARATAVLCSTESLCAIELLRRWLPFGHFICSHHTPLRSAGGGVIGSLLDRPGAGTGNPREGASPGALSDITERMSECSSWTESRPGTPAFPSESPAGSRARTPDVLNWQLSMLPADILALSGGGDEGGWASRGASSEGGGSDTSRESPLQHCDVGPGGARPGSPTRWELPPSIPELGAAVPELGTALSWRQQRGGAAPGTELAVPGAEIDEAYWSRRGSCTSGSSAAYSDIFALVDAHQGSHTEIDAEFRATMVEATVKAMTMSGPALRRHERWMKKMREDHAAGVASAEKEFQETARLGTGWVVGSRFKVLRNVSVKKEFEDCGKPSAAAIGSLTQGTIHTVLDSRHSASGQTRLQVQIRHRIIGWCNAATANGAGLVARLGSFEPGGAPPPSLPIGDRPRVFITRDGRVAATDAHAPPPESGKRFIPLLEIADAARVEVDLAKQVLRAAATVSRDKNWTNMLQKFNKNGSGLLSIRSALIRSCPTVSSCALQPTGSPLQHGAPQQPTHETPLRGGTLAGSSSVASGGTWAQQR